MDSCCLLLEGAQFSRVCGRKMSKYIDLSGEDLIATGDSEKIWSGGKRFVADVFPHTGSVPPQLERLVFFGGRAPTCIGPK